jgi:hypothetical protein
LEAETPEHFFAATFGNKLPDAREVVTPDPACQWSPAGEHDNVTETPFTQPLQKESPHTLKI